MTTDALREAGAPETLTVAGAPSARAGLHLVLAGLCLAAAILLWWMQAPYAFPLDDANITLHNAEVLLTGQDASYGTSPLTGATSLVHLAAVAALAPLLGLVLASYVVSVLGVVAYVQGLATLGLQLGSLRLASLLVAVGIGTGFATFHLLNGLETGLAMAAVVWAIALAAAPRPGRMLPLLCGVLPFIRPELGALGALLLARQLCLRLRTSGGGRQAWRDGAIDVALALATALPWILWSFMATGSILPGTIGAKQAFFAEGAMPFAGKAVITGSALIDAGFGPLLVGLVALRRDSLDLALVLFLALFLVAFGTTFPSGLMHNSHRYLYVLLPVAVFGLGRLRRLGSEGPFRILAAAALAWCAYSLTRAPALYRTEANWSRREHVALAAWANANLPADATVLIHDAGYLGFATRLRLVDLVGLKTPDSVADHRRWTEPSQSRDRYRAIASIAARNHATHAVILRDADGFWSSLGDDLRRAGWQLERLREPTEAVGYEVFRLTPPA